VPKLEIVLSPGGHSGRQSRRETNTFDSKTDRGPGSRTSVTRLRHASSGADQWLRNLENAAAMAARAAPHRMIRRIGALAPLPCDDKCDGPHNHDRDPPPPKFPNRILSMTGLSIGNERLIWLNQVARNGDAAQPRATPGRNRELHRNTGNFLSNGARIQSRQGRGRDKFGGHDRISTAQRPRLVSAMTKTRKSASGPKPSITGRNSSLRAIAPPRILKANEALRTTHAKSMPRPRIHRDIIQAGDHRGKLQAPNRPA